MGKLTFDIDPVLEGRARLTDAQALELLQHASLHDLGQWALEVTRRMHPEDYRTYVIDRNINYTNVCTARCTFCAFRRDHDDTDSYTLSYEQVGEKIRELLSIGGTQVLMQGGMNDRLPIEYYEGLLRYIKTHFPSVHVHAFSPPEFVEFERFFGLDVRQIIRRFADAGLDTIPGGGGEIFSPRVRRRIGLGKCTGDDWLRVMRVAHEEGLHTSCTMMMGHIEFVRERVEHMSALRDLQDYALALSAALGGGGADGGARGTAAGPLSGVIRRTIERHRGVFEKSGFDTEEGLARAKARRAAGRPAFGAYTAFIHWPFQRENTPLGRAKAWDEAVHGPFDDSTHEDILRGRVVRLAGAEAYLRTLAVARLYFDNIPNLQSSWVTMGPKVGQLALFFGANDMGSVMMEENVVSAAGATFKLSEREICRLIRDAGWVPAQRDQYYRVLRRHDGPDAPDLRPDPDARVRNVPKVADGYVGPAPLLAGDIPTAGDVADGREKALRLQLTVLGDGQG
ncbi:MAG: radical SAM protein [Tepidisphaerales bacterium]